MEQVWRSVRPLLPLIPLGLFLILVATVILSLIRTRRGTGPRTAIIASALEVTLAASILSVLILTLPPSIHAPRTINLMPFEELRHAVGNFGISQLVGNTLLFVPLGFLAPLRWPRIDSPIGAFAAAAGFSIAIEVLQFVLPTGRQSSVTDVVMNTTGASAGYALMVTIRGSIKLSRRHPGNRQPVSPSA
jgi:glycopeptide antibiotics resistance protein